MVEFLRSHAVALPTLAKFAIAMAVIVWVPRLSRQARLPAVVGLLLSGIAIGPHGLDVIGPHRPIADFFADLGKLLLMFCAGLEIDLALFRRARSRVIAFGVLTTLLPLLLGTGAGFLFGFPPVAAVVLGSLLASHTLLAAPTVVRLGATRLEPIAVTFGATVVSDTLSLVVFAVCVSHLSTRLFRFRTGCATRRDRHLRPADSIWPEPAGSVLLKESGGCRGLPISS